MHARCMRAACARVSAELHNSAHTRRITTQGAPLHACGNARDAAPRPTQRASWRSPRSDRAPPSVAAAAHCAHAAPPHTRTPSLAAFSTKPRMTKGMPTQRKVTTTHRGVKMGCHAGRRCCRNSLSLGRFDLGPAAGGELGVDIAPPVRRAARLPASSSKSVTSRQIRRHTRDRAYSLRKRVCVCRMALLLRRAVTQVPAQVRAWRRLVRGASRAASSRAALHRYGRWAARA